MTTSSPSTDTSDVTTVDGVIDLDLPTHRISRHVYGHFSEHLGRCIYGGFYVGEDADVPHDRGIRLDVVEALRELDIPNLRWPGGCFADDYHWRDGVGPAELRPRMVNSHWGDVVEDNSFGTHEFMHLCELLGAEPYVSANVGSGSVQESSEWVQYLTRSDSSPMADLRREHGRDEPWSVRFWGLGNEPWGCGGNMSAESYADLARVFATYSRDTSSNTLYRIAAGAAEDDYRWTEVLMQALGRSFGDGEVTGHGNSTFQAVSFHYYTVPGPRTQQGSALEFDTADYYRTLREASRVEELLAGHAAVMDAYDPERHVGLVLDEWGTWFGVERGTNPGFLEQQNSLRDALVAAVHLDAFHRHADRLVMANIAQTVNVLQAMVLIDPETGTMVLTPSYHVFEMNKRHQDAENLAVHLRTPLPIRPVRENPLTLTGRHPRSSELTTVSVSASTRDDRVLVSMSNLDAEEGLRLRLDLRGAPVREPVGRLLTAGTLQSHNTSSAGATVAPGPFPEGGVRLEGSVLLVDLPAHSFATVDLTLV